MYLSSIYAYLLKIYYSINFQAIALSYSVSCIMRTEKNEFDSFIQSFMTII